MFGPMSGNSLDHVPTWWAGAGGGAVASLGPFVGSASFDEGIGNFFAGEPALGLKVFSVSLIGTVLMALCGAVIGFFLQAKTQNRWTIFIMCAAFTSIGASGLPGVKSILKRVAESQISVAYAADGQACASVGEDVTVFGGLKKFFGLEDTGYYVIVASVKKPPDAEPIISKIKSEDPSLRVFVGERIPCNEWYPVVIGPSTNSFEEAKQIQAKVKKTQSGENAYISYRTR